MRAKDRSTACCVGGGAARRFVGRQWRAAVTTTALALALIPATAAPAAAEESLSHLSLEELLQVKVTSVSKKEQRLGDTPAAVFVISDEEIRRSGVTSLPDALRMAPGLEVAQLTGSRWAVSARGFNHIYANKLLVLEDGRSLYTPLFSGTEWELQDVVLEDLSRVEVIRGPGGTIWGANAVNGVINILSKSAKETQGTLLSFGGSPWETFSTVRYGFQTGTNSWLRIYAKYHRIEDLTAVDGSDAEDESQRAFGGFRWDWEPDAQNRLTLEGEAGYTRVSSRTMVYDVVPPYASDVQQIARNTPAHLLGRWLHTLSDSSELTFQSYYDHAPAEGVLVSEKRETVDLEMEHHLGLGSRNDLIWGLGYRLHADSFTFGHGFSLSPVSRRSQLFSSFVQDELTLVPERLKFTAGVKLEHNDYSGWEAQPSGRLTWTPGEKHTLWGAVSQAVRTPSRVERDVRLRLAVIPPPPSTIEAVILGSPAIQGEHLLAYELGYRWQALSTLSFDVAGYYNRYSDVVGSTSLGLLPPSTPGADAEAAQVFDNNASAEAYGVELSTQWSPASWNRWTAGGSYQEIHSHGAPALTPHGNSPSYQFQIQSHFDLGDQVELDLWGRYVDRLADLTLQVPAYVTADARVAWRPRPNLEISLVGQNLLQPRHVEFRATDIVQTSAYIPRTLYGKVTWSF